MAVKKNGRKPKISNDEHWGIRLKACLNERKLSNRAAAKMAGVSPSVINGWILHGVTPADLKIVKKLADTLNVDFSWLLVGERSRDVPFQMNEIFKETNFFDGIVRLRVDKLEPRKK